MGTLKEAVWALLDMECFIVENIMNEADNVVVEEIRDVILVIAELKYSESSRIESGTGGCGTTKTILGIATDDIEAAKLITEDHFDSIASAGFNPLLFPLAYSDENDEYWVKVDGSREEVVFSNLLKWYTYEIPFNTLLDEFEL